jgi:hypothetical protein
MQSARHSPVLHGSLFCEGEVAIFTIEDMEVMMGEIVQEFPEELFRQLNGGILILPDAKMHEKNRNDDLFIMGEYHVDGVLGRYIALYYGSFVRVCGSLPQEALRKRLTATLKHEFLHHMESLAGERGLEIRDAQDIARYLRRSSR